MDSFSGLSMGLGNIFLMSKAQTRSISAENPDGAKGGGAKANPEAGSPASELGRGWKVRPWIPLPAGETVTLAEIKGPGVIQQIWLTVAEVAYRNCVLRMYWDGEATASVEVPLGDFFACGHASRAKIASLAVAVNSSGGMNCYWPMPFRKSARITLENQHNEKIDGFYYQINYCLTEVPAEAAYFHAQWRRSMTTRECPEHTILDGVKGQGQYVGTYLAWTQMSDGWWGEGEIKFFMDGDKGDPTICGTGTEDYFGGAWCFGTPQNPLGETYTTAFLGYPLFLKAEGTVPKHGLYRWHIMDPVRFGKDLRVTMQALGWRPNAKFQPLTDDIASTAYWYQAEPHGKFPKLPSQVERYAR
jgi:hypothetical protein